MTTRALSSPLKFACRETPLSSGPCPWSIQTRNGEEEKWTSVATKSEWHNCHVFVSSWSGFKETTTKKKSSNVSCTFFLCSFCRSLNCSILFTSSFSIAPSEICRCPTFSISEIKRKGSLQRSNALWSFLNVRSNGFAHVISFRQTTLSGSWNKQNTYTTACWNNSAVLNARSVSHLQIHTRFHTSLQFFGRWRSALCHISPLLPP